MNYLNKKYAVIFKNHTTQIMSENMPQQAVQFILANNGFVRGVWWDDTNSADWDLVWWIQLMLIQS